jgi:hypothetical protein
LVVPAIKNCAEPHQHAMLVTRTMRANGAQRARGPIRCIGGGLSETGDKHRTPTACVGASEADHQAVPAILNLNR